MIVPTWLTGRNIGYTVAGLVLSFLLGATVTLKLQVNGLQDDLEDALRDVSTYKQNAEEHRNNFLTGLVRLATCQAKNSRLERDSQKTLEELEERLKEARKATKDSTKDIREVLESEDCADVTIPSDLERLLRERASRANRDT